MSQSNKYLAAISACLLITASGCLKEKEEVAGSEAYAANHRSILFNSLNKQAVHLVGGINQVVVEGQFFKNMPLENPPEPIPMTDDNEVSQAINYLLTVNASDEASITYKPDSRICSEIMAKNNPAPCIEAMKKVTLKQIPADESSGQVEIRVGQAQPMNLYYSADVISSVVTATELVKALTEVSNAIEAAGDEGFADSLPYTHEGAISLTVSSYYGISSVVLSVLSDINIQGQDEEGGFYGLTMPKADQILAVSFNVALDAGLVQAAMPAFTFKMPARNDNEVIQQLEINFPGASGMMSLDNALSRVTLSGVKLAEPNATARVNGQLAAELFSVSTVEAYVQTEANQEVTFRMNSHFEFDLNLIANDLFSDAGQLSVNVQPSTEARYNDQTKQAQFLSGALEIIGTGSFDGQIQISAGECVTHDEDSDEILTKTVCQ